MVASDSYKGCLTSAEANTLIETGIHQYNPDFEVVKYTIGDGGEGTMEAFLHTCHGELKKVIVHDAYFKEMEAAYCLIENGNTAVMDVAEVVGLERYKREERRPLYATSYGIGEMILDADAQGAKKIIVGLGGSCTNDGGVGLLNALGVKFYDEQGKYLKTSAASLPYIKRVDFKGMKDLSKIEFIAACDVSNHLLGSEGATYTYGKQKGLDRKQMAKTEQGMVNYVKVMRDCGYELDEPEGSGAAGGLGAVLIGVLKGKMRPGLALLFEYNNFEQDLKDCDLCISGEGQSDRQTLYGKVPFGVLEVCKRNNVPCICLSGALGLDYRKLYEAGFIGVYSIADRSMSFTTALSCASEKLVNASFGLINTIDYFRRKQ